MKESLSLHKLVVPIVCIEDVGRAGAGRRQGFLPKILINAR